MDGSPAPSSAPENRRARTAARPAAATENRSRDMAMTVAARPARPVTLGRRLAAEGLGTALLLAAIVGSGIMGDRLSGGNVAIALLANAFATGAALVALILTFGPISGAHFNPAVSLSDAWEGGLTWCEA